MKHATCSRDLGVFDFKEEDELTDTYHQCSKFANPKFDDAAITKYQFLQHASSGSITQIKEIRNMEDICVVAIDDDEHGSINDISGDPLDSPDKASSKQSDGFGSVSDSVFQQRYDFSDDRVKPQCSSMGMEIRISGPCRLPPANGHISPIIPELPCSNGSVDSGVSDGHDSIKEWSPSTCAFEEEENTVSIDEQAQDQSVSGLVMDEMDSVLLHTDYVTYGDKYFPVSLILISKEFVKVKTSALKDDLGAFSCEWKIDDIFRIESRWGRMANIATVRIHLFTKDAVQSENAHGTSAVEVLEFLVHDPHWPQRQEWITSLNVRYKAAWSIGLNVKSCDGDAFPLESSESSSDPYIPNFEEPFEEVVYPKGDVDAVSISKRDVDLLQPEIFINDTIIDFYIKYLKTEISPSDGHRFHFFNSFFFRKLADLDKNPSSIFDGKSAFQRVRKWTRKVNIFEKDYIFIPVNYNLHWSLIVICHPGDVANFSDENIDESLKVPCILHMDSIRGSHTGLKDLFQSYLLEEWKERQKETSEDISLKFLNLRFVSLELPQQENCSDCGLFLLHYAELFIAEAPENFSPFRINKFENFLKPDWFMPAEASLKRVHIQRLICQLLGNCSPENFSPCNQESHHSALPENNENDNGIEIISEKRSPEKSWYLSCSQPVQGMEMGLLDMSLNRNPQCINESDLGMGELLEHCQRYDRGASFEQLGDPMPSTREEAEAVDLLSPSSLGQTGLHPVDGLAAGACLSYTPRDFDDGFPWNSGLSVQGDPEGNSSPASNCSSDDSKEMGIIESEQEPQDVSLGQNKNLDQPKENIDIDSLNESYASVSSDMMETPAENSQELATIYGSNDEDDPSFCNREEVQEPFQQELDQTEDDEKFVVEDSSSESDEERAAKRVRVAP